MPWLALAIGGVRAYGLDIIDGVYNDFKDDAGFREECEYMDARSAWTARR